jgi:DNA-3-methyladenine glycosylase I
MAVDEIKRCWWCGDDELYQQYHDREWGVAIHDNRLLFEFLCLEGAQAGLSWITILRKREHYRRVFDDFDAEKIARYADSKIATLLQDPGIVRNRLKVNGFVKNARAFHRHWIITCGISSMANHCRATGNRSSRCRQPVLFRTPWLKI